MDGYFLTADLLGFGNIVRNSNDAELKTRVGNWIELIDQAKAASRLYNHIQLISDTIFVAADSSEDGLKSIVSFARELLNAGSRRSLPVRGGISHGNFEWGTLTYGKAVIQSHQLESRQNWIGISCQADLPHAASLWGPDGLICYPPPMKSGQIQLLPVIVWDVPPFDEFRASLLTNGLMKAGETLAWPWAQKFANTIEFRTYLEIVGGAGGNYERFHGTLPVETITANVVRPPDA